MEHSRQTERRQTEEQTQREQEQKEGDADTIGPRDRDKRKGVLQPHEQPAQLGRQIANIKEGVCRLVPRSTNQ